MYDINHLWCTQETNIKHLTSSTSSTFDAPRRLNTACGRTICRMTAGFLDTQTTLSPVLLAAPHSAATLVAAIEAEAWASRACGACLVQDRDVDYACRLSQNALTRSA